VFLCQKRLRLSSEVDECKPLPLPPPLPLPLLLLLQSQLLLLLQRLRPGAYTRPLFGST